MKIKVDKIRLDLLLVEKQIFELGEKAKIAIMEGKIYVNNQKEDKPGKMIKTDANVVFKGDENKYVSRDTYKLEKALQYFNISVNNMICLDIGASTGGFTDCLIQYGVKFVYSIDCGTNQLDYRLRINKKVKSIENLNARYLDIKHFDNIS